MNRGKLTLLATAGASLAAGLALGSWFTYRFTSTRAKTPVLAPAPPAEAPVKDVSESAATEASSLSLSGLFGTLHAQYASLSAEEQSEVVVERLFIGFDLESTGLDTFQDHITQIAAVVEGVEPEQSFMSYCRTDRKIPKKVQEITGITKALLADKPTFREAFHGFIGWLCAALADATASALMAHPGRMVIVQPVLLAHNGVSFDLPLLFNEMRRHGIAVELVQLLNMHTADSLKLYRLLRSDPVLSQLPELEVMHATGSLSLTKLYPAYTGQQYNAHDALADVRAMNELVFRSPLATPAVLDVFHAQFVTSPQETLDRFAYLIRKRRLRDALRWSNGKSVVGSTILGRIIDHGMTLNTLSQKFHELGAEGMTAFLLQMGISQKAKPIQELVRFLRDHASPPPSHSSS